MKSVRIIILLLLAKTLMCQSLPNNGFEDWHISKGVMNPIFWDTENEIDFILVEKAEGYKSDYAAQLNVIWDEVIKSYSAATLSLFEDSFKGHINSLLGYYKGRAGGNDSLMILIKQVNENEVVRMGMKTFESTENQWKEFTVNLKSISDLKPDKTEIIISILADGKSQGTTHFTVDELQITKKIEK